MKKERNIYSLLWKIAFIAGLVVAAMIYGGTYFYDDIKNLYLLPLSYSISMLLVKCFYNNKDMGIAVAIIEVTKFARFIMTPLVYILSDQIIGYMGVDLRYEYHEKAVVLMCYEITAVSLVMLWYHKNHNKNNKPLLKTGNIKFKPNQLVYLFTFVWIILVLFVGSYRESLLNFSLQENTASQHEENISNNLLNIVFQYGKIYIYTVMLSFARNTRKNTTNFPILLFASILYISSCWSDGGQTVSRWGMIVASLLSIYALYYFYPTKKKIILTGGCFAVIGVIILGTLIKLSSWDVGTSNINEATGSIFATEMFDAYFQGVYGVSNGLSSVDIYSNKVGIQNFLSELFYHFPFAVRFLDLTNHTWAEYYYKLAIGDKSKICPSLIQSDFYFGDIGSPLFSCFAVFLALWFTDRMEKEFNFTAKLLYVYVIFWLSLFNCINFTVVEAHIWSAIIGIWICKLGDPKKKQQYQPAKAKNNCT